MMFFLSLNRLNTSCNYTRQPIQENRHIAVATAIAGIAIIGLAILYAYYQKTGPSLAQPPSAQPPSAQPPSAQLPSVQQHPAPKRPGSLRGKILELPNHIRSKPRQPKQPQPLQQQSFSEQDAVKLEEIVKEILTMQDRLHDKTQRCLDTLNTVLPSRIDGINRYLHLLFLALEKSPATDSDYLKAGRALLTSNIPNKFLYLERILKKLKNPDTNLEFRVDVARELFEYGESSHFPTSTFDRLMRLNANDQSNSEYNWSITRINGVNVDDTAPQGDKDFQDVWVNKLTLDLSGSQRDIFYQRLLTEIQESDNKNKINFTKNHLYLIRDQNIRDPLCLNIGRKTIGLGNFIGPNGSENFNFLRHLICEIKNPDLRNRLCLIVGKPILQSNEKDKFDSLNILAGIMKSSKEQCDFCYDVAEKLHKSNYPWKTDYWALCISRMGDDPRTKELNGWITQQAAL